MAEVGHRQVLDRGVTSEVSPSAATEAMVSSEEGIWNVEVITLMELMQASRHGRVKLAPNDTT